MITRVWFKFKDLELPILKIDQTFRNEQIIIIFTSIDSNPHITIHFEDNKPKLSTHHDENKIESIWDSTRVEIARSLGYRDPERHGKYYHHQPLIFPRDLQGNTLPAHLAGRYIQLSDPICIKDRYNNDDKYLIETDKEGFMLNILYAESIDSVTKKYNNRLVLNDNHGVMFFELDDLN